MTKARIVLFAASLSLLQIGCSDDAGTSYTVPLPQPTGSGSGTVVLHDLERPAGRPMILRVYAEGEGSAAVLLGSIGLEAISPEAEGTRREALVQVEATAGLTHWAAEHPGRDSIHLRIVAIVVGNMPTVSTAWHIERVEIHR